MRKALAIMPRRITHVMEHRPPQHAPDRAYMMTAELFLMQHTCHWYCRSKTIRLCPHDGPPPDAARAAGQLGVEPTRKAYLALIRGH